MQAPSLPPQDLAVYPTVARGPACLARSSAGPHTLKDISLGTKHYAYMERVSHQSSTQQLHTRAPSSAFFRAQKAQDTSPEAMNPEDSCASEEGRGEVP